MELIVAQLVSKFLAFYGTRGVSFDYILIQFSLHYIHFNIIFPSTNGLPKWPLLFRFLY